MLMMMKKRIREEHEEQQQQQNNSITKCLMLLQSHNQFMMTKPINLTNPTNPINSNGLSGGHVFECKTCNKRFSSFQALGGHRASHKKAETRY
ncbi:hypothetical protein F8388_025173 [Cannabis sativa]|uniref:C2H2-type domain-containing protein n=1 Tax=Cannabis sativa TaxID=3483 RepID=A0A7J6FUW2_CANSA|nr:hypothetical protein F8388_025173 [Cannabis sativa]